MTESVATATTSSLCDWVEMRLK